MSRRLVLLLSIAAIGACFMDAGVVHATTQQKSASPPPRPAPPPKPAAKPGASAGKTTQGKAGTAGGSGAKGAAAADPRSQLMEMLHPGGNAGGAKLAPNAHQASVHPPVARTAFARPAHIPHNPAHHVGRIGDLHHHAPFEFARDHHRFHRRYYLQDGHWFFYDEPAAGDAAIDDGSALPVCDLNADDCQGDIVPLADNPGDAGAAAGDTGTVPPQ
jgi:hypothetical protein